MNAMNLFEGLESRRLMAFTGLPIQIGGTGWDFGQQVAATPDGGYIASGIFSGTVDFDPGAGQTRLTAKSDTDIYIAKYDASSALQWVKQIGGTARQDGIKQFPRRIDIAADPERAGGVFVNGVGQSPRAAGEYVNDVVVAVDGSIFLAGDFTGTVDFDPGAGTHTFKTFDTNYYDAFVLKLDSAGSFVWADRFGDRFTDTANAIALDSSNNVFVTGLFSRDVNFQPGTKTFKLSASGREDAYVLKLNSAGALAWVNSFGGDSNGEAQRDVGNDLAVDSAGNVYVAGSFAATADFDPSKTGVARLSTAGDTDGFLAKYSSAGRFRAVLPFRGTAFDALTSVAVDSNNDIIVAGYFQGKKFDYDPTAAVHNLIATPKDGDSDPKFLDVFVEKLARGRVAWVQQLAGTGTELVGDMKLDSSDNIILSGSFYHTAKFGTAGPTVTSVLGSDFKDQNDDDRRNSYDAFVWKLSATNGTTQWANTIGNEQDDFGVGIAVGSDDSVLLTGRFRNTVDFDTTAGTSLLTSVGLSDAFVAGFNVGGLPLT
ncbi:MAG TPA: SBBP repeat-containing protein [Tepidisphaeraceae bacterium]|nr:SBBP repeat-containing protein [Tepidisphaeraceae bacterium]